MQKELYRLHGLKANTLLSIECVLTLSPNPSVRKFYSEIYYLARQAITIRRVIQRKRIQYNTPRADN